MSTKIVMIILTLKVLFFYSLNTISQDKKIDKSQLEKLVKKDWLGFDNKGNLNPNVKLVYEGYVDFRYHRDGKLLFLKKYTEIYKYETPIFLGFLIPEDRIDYKTSPEMAYLSYNSQVSTKPDNYFEKLDLEIDKINNYFLFYRIVIKSDQYGGTECVVLLDSGEFPIITYRDKNTNEWKVVEQFSYEDNLLFGVIYDCMDLSEISGEHDKKLEEKIRQLIKNQVITFDDSKIYEELEQRPQPSEKPERKPLPPEELKRIEKESKKPVIIKPETGLNIELENRCGGIEPSKPTRISPEE